MPIARHFSTSAVNMLTASATIIDNGIEVKDFLVTERPAWEDPFLPNQKTRIDKAIKEILGIDNADELHRRTEDVNKARAEALIHLGKFKAQVKEDFSSIKPQRNNILTSLGLMSGGRFIRLDRLDDEEFSQMLQTFKKGLSPEMRAEIEAKGTNPAHIDAILTKADEFYPLNIQQEHLKNVSKTLTDKQEEELNAIYDDVSSFAKISRQFYRSAPKSQRDKFSFSAILRQQGRAIKKEKEEEKETAK